MERRSSIRPSAHPPIRRCSSPALTVFGTARPRPCTVSRAPFRGTPSPRSSGRLAVARRRSCARSTACMISRRKRGTAATSCSTAGRSLRPARTSSRCASASARELPDRVERALRQAALWDEVQDRLREPGTALSGGQQQRLCIARALANEPEVLLMDEPCSALDPIATQRIEELLVELKQTYTIVIVTHNMQQAARVSDYTGFFYVGHLVEFETTQQVFTRPTDERTEAYITGRFG